MAKAAAVASGRRKYSLNTPAPRTWLGLGSVWGLGLGWGKGKVKGKGKGKGRGWG